MRAMNLSSRALALVGTVVLLQACTSGGEDPRITLCRGLAADFSGIEASQWSSDGNRFVRPEYAEVKVKGANGEVASCFYEFDAVEELAAAGSQEFFDYATLPYRMVFNGVDVEKGSLTAAVTLQQKELPAEALRQAEQAVETAKQHIQKAVEAAQER